MKEDHRRRISSYSVRLNEPAKPHVRFELFDVPGELISIEYPRGYDSPRQLLNEAIIYFNGAYYKTIGFRLCQPQHHLDITEHPFVFITVPESGLEYYAIWSGPTVESQVCSSNRQMMRW